MRLGKARPTLKFANQLKGMLIARADRLTSEGNNSGTTKNGIGPAKSGKKIKREITIGYTINREKNKNISV